jgi:hypothetical protein
MCPLAPVLNLQQSGCHSHFLLHRHHKLIIQLEAYLSLSLAHPALPPETVQKTSPAVCASILLCLTIPSCYVQSTLPPKSASSHTLCFIPSSSSHFRVHLVFCFATSAASRAVSSLPRLAQPPQSASGLGFASEGCRFGACISRHIAQPC